MHLPRDHVRSKKIGHPYNKEFATGAVSMDSMIINEHPDIPQEYIKKNYEAPKIDAIKIRNLHG